MTTSCCTDSESPPRRVSTGGTFWCRSITGTGERASCWRSAGTAASMCSNGSAWCSNASSTRSPALASRVATSGSPDRSRRSGRILMKKPINGSSSASSRPAVVWMQSSRPLRR
ncbi:hypothetical protein [Burkholderia gladioli]